MLVVHWAKQNRTNDILATEYGYLQEDCDPDLPITRQTRGVCMSIRIRATRFNGAYGGDN